MLLFCEEGTGTSALADTRMRTHGGEYSGSWLAFSPPSPPVARSIGRCGKSYPVTAARLLPVFTEFLAAHAYVSICLYLAKNWGHPGIRCGGCQACRTRRLRRNAVIRKG